MFQKLADAANWLANVCNGRAEYLQIRVNKWIERAKSWRSIEQKLRAYRGK